VKANVRQVGRQAAGCGRRIYRNVPADINKEKQNKPGHHLFSIGGNREKFNAISAKRIVGSARTCAKLSMRLSINFVWVSFGGQAEVSSLFGTAFLGDFHRFLKRRTRVGPREGSIQVGVFSVKMAKIACESA